MRNRILFLALLCGCVFQCIFAIQPVASFAIPAKVEYAGQTVDLSRYDMRERFDKEQIIIAYNHSASILGLKRANRYFPIIERILTENGIPTDFKYLAVAESNLDARAVSTVQAAGFWQLMPRTAEELGLEVNDEVDERYNIEKSTVAACRYFKSAYAKYHNWITVAASYNCGMGRVSTEQEKQQVESAFDLLLPTETSRYVFRILAFKRFFENPRAFGYELRREDFYPVIRFKNVMVNDSVSDWTQWAAQNGINYFQLKDFNAWLRDRKLTNKTKKQYVIQVPDKECLNYSSSNVIIYNPLWVTF